MRTIRTATGVAWLAAMLAGCAGSSEMTTASALSPDQPGLQIYSLRGLIAAKGVPAGLDQAKDFGFRTLELGGTYNLKPAEFLPLLKERGLKGVRLIISDACMGLAESAAEFFPSAAWQRCVVHFYRNVFSHVPRPKMREVAAMLKAIHASEDIVSARDKAFRVGAKLRDVRLTRAAELVERGIEETLAYYQFPEEHWRRVRTNNPLERILREIRRRTRVVGAFPDGQSALNLAAARLRHIAGSEWSTKKYLSMEFLKDLQASTVTA